jgi:hypothetical protein
MSLWIIACSALILALCACSDKDVQNPGETAEAVVGDANFDYGAYYTDMMGGMTEKLQFGYDIIALNDSMSESAWYDLVEYMSENSEDYLISVARKDVPPVFKGAHEKLSLTSEMYQNIVSELKKISAGDIAGRQQIFNEIDELLAYAGRDTEY